MQFWSSMNSFGSHRHCCGRRWQGGCSDDGPDGREVWEELQGQAAHC